MVNFKSSIKFFFNISVIKLILDLSWNHIGETGAIVLLESLKNNKILTELNIKGNSVSEKTSIEIGKTKMKNE